MIIIFFSCKGVFAKLSPFYFVVLFFFFFFRQRVSDDCHSKSIFPIDRVTFYAGLRYFVSMVLHLTFSFHLFLCKMRVNFFLLSKLKNITWPTLPVTILFSKF